VALARQAHSVMGHTPGMWSCIENFLAATATSGPQHWECPRHRGDMVVNAVGSLEKDGRWINATVADLTPQKLLVVPTYNEAESLIPPPRRLPRRSRRMAYHTRSSFG
jgi:hypothetical protein